MVEKAWSAFLFLPHCFLELREVVSGFGNPLPSLFLRFHSIGVEGWKEKWIRNTCHLFNSKVFSVAIFPLLGSATYMPVTDKHQCPLWDLAFNNDYFMEHRERSLEYLKDTVLWSGILGPGWASHSLLMLGALHLVAYPLEWGAGKWLRYNFLRAHLVPKDPTSFFPLHLWHSNQHECRPLRVPFSKTCHPSCITVSYTFS